VVVLAVAAGFVGGLMAGRVSIDRPLLTSQSAKVISAEGFQLIDRQGTTHAALNTQDGGAPELLFFDSNHKPRVVFDMTSSGDPLLFLMDADGTIRTVLGLGFGANGSPFIRLRDKDKKVIWSVP
jgi:hypothetical protein